MKESIKGVVDLICIRPSHNKRKILNSVFLSKMGGIEGDLWAKENPTKFKRQISIINSDAIRFFSGQDSPKEWSLSGDNLYVDFNLHTSFLPAGSKIKIGQNVILKITEVPHLGCVKFKQRYGEENFYFLKKISKKEERMRGVFAMVEEEGVIHVGDEIIKQQ